MKIVTVTVKVHTGPDPAEPFNGIDPRVDVEVEEGFPAQVGLAAAIGGIESTLKALQQKYEEMGFDGPEGTASSTD